MESLAINLDDSTLVAPKTGFVLIVRFKLQDRNEFDTIFCDYISISGRTLRLIGCRCKTFVVGGLPCDYALRVGSMEIGADHVMDVLQLATPPWYYRLEEDARMLMSADRLVLEVGMLDVFAQLTGSGS